MRTSKISRSLINLELREVEELAQDREQCDDIVGISSGEEGLLRFCLVYI